MRNGSLWQRNLFEKEVISHSINWSLSILRIWKHIQYFVLQGCFFNSIILYRLRRPIELKFSQVCNVCILCWDTPTNENTGLWYLQKVSGVFNGIYKHDMNLYTYYIMFQSLKPDVESGRSPNHDHYILSLLGLDFQSLHRTAWVFPWLVLWGFPPTSQTETSFLMFSPLDSWLVDTVIKFAFLRVLGFTTSNIKRNEIW